MRSVNIRRAAPLCLRVCANTAALVYKSAILRSTRGQRTSLPSVRAHVNGIESCSGEHTFITCTEQALGALAEKFGRAASNGDVYLLHGDVGTGKSAFSRALIRAMARDETLSVPSPTFLLKNVYDEHDGPPVHHFDLYRLSSPTELGRLYLEESFKQAVSLVEWPEMLGNIAPQHRLEVKLYILYKVSTVGDLGSAAYLVDDIEAVLAHEHCASLEEDEVHDQFADRRWRAVRLLAHGPDWAERLNHVVEEVKQARIPGLLSMPQGSWQALVSSGRLAKVMRVRPASATPGSV